VKLRQLELSGTRVTDLSVLTSCPELETVDLHSTGVGDIIALGQLRRLKTLYLYSCINVSDVSALSECSSLADLHISGCGEVSGLFAASANGHQVVVHALLRLDGIDVNKARTVDGKTALFVVSL
jgi:hypothetical protein